MFEEFEEVEDDVNLWDDAREVMRAAESVTDAD